MNNNYHTQLDKQNNMLNEIAANNQLLQNDKNTMAMNPALLQQMQNFPGTPINKNSQQITPQTMQQLTPQQQMLYAQQLALQNQIYQQQLNPNMNQYANQTYAKQPQPQDDEIELSEPKPDPKQKINEIAQQVATSKQQQGQPYDTADQQVQVLADPKVLRPHRRPHPPIPNPTKITPAKSNKTIEYIIIPLLLVCVFVALVHPKTSGLLEKYLPKMENIKGYLVRGLILAIVYIVIKLVTSSIGNKS